MSEKVISIHPDLFQYGFGKKTKKNKPKPEKTIKVKNTAANQRTTKRRILEQLRKKQEKHMTEFINEKKTALEDTGSNDFVESLNYIQEAISETERAQQQKQKQHSFKNHSVLSTNPLPSHLESLSINMDDLTAESGEPVHIAPPKVPLPVSQWGCLKQGNLPTYRTWKTQTQKSHEPRGNENINFAPTIMVSGGPDQTPNGGPSNGGPPSNGVSSNGVLTTPNFFTPNCVLPQEPQSGGDIKNMIPFSSQKPPPKKYKPMRQKRTLRRTFSVGKSKTAPKISVLVSNKHIRRNVTTKSVLLKQTPIDDIKKFLVKRGFIKVGSVAPNDVLRKMYESVSLLCGDAQNHNPDNLLYNYFHSDEK
jgi:hypothetical protein